MSDNLGQPIADNAPIEDAPVAAPQIDQGGQPATAAPSPTSDKYAGKTPEELARILHDQESHVGRLGNEVGTLRQQLEYYQTLMAQAQAAPRQPQEHPRQEDNAPQFDWDNPGRAVKQTVRQELEPMYQRIQTDMAASQAQYAEFIAKQQAPHLFKDRDGEVRTMMLQGIRTGTIHPSVAANPEMWKMVAWQLEGAKKGFGSNGTVNAVSPTATETPTSSRSPQGSVEPLVLDDQMKAAARAFGKTDAELAQMMSVREG